jgi:hypothetical protein
MDTIPAVMLVFGSFHVDWLDGIRTPEAAAPQEGIIGDGFGSDSSRLHQEPSP